MSWESIYAQLKDVTILSVSVRMLAAAVFGGFIGMERGRRRYAAGMRTHMLVCMGATMVMLTNQYVFMEFGVSDPTRLGAQVISGIGFLGVGTIIVDRQQQVRGLTTAAGLWASACMGLALGIGFYPGAIIGFSFILGTHAILNKLEYKIINRSRTMEVYAEFESHNEINRFLSIAMTSAIKVVHIEIVQPRDYGGKGDLRAAAIIILQLPKKCLHEEVLESFENFNGLITIEELR